MTQKSIREDVMQALVDLVQICCERYARGIECGLIARLHTGDVVLDRPTPSLKAHVRKGATVLRKASLSDLLLEVVELVMPNHFLCHLGRKTQTDAVICGHLGAVSEEGLSFPFLESAQEFASFARLLRLFGRARFLGLGKRKGSARLVVRFEHAVARF